IAVLVGQGDDQRSFDVHESLITSRSRFFCNAMNGKWKEAEERTVALLEDDPIVFELYLQCLYAGHANLDEDIEIGDQYVLWGRLFVLAEKLRDLESKNIIVDAL
ncbi:uncharacterized protein BDR25DRAFT_171249, partial [Lindgomyces ingoldianus]